MKYRKKPVVVEAWEYKSNADAVRQLIPPAPHHLLRFSRWRWCWQIKTLEGWLSISPFDYIIKGINGEFYPCKPDIFEATYEVVFEDE